MPGDTLLIVDDDKLWNRYATQYFGKVLNYRTYTAETAQEAIRLVDEVRPDFVLLDYHLGEIDSTRVCSHIRSAEKTKKTILLIVSGDPKSRDAAYEECQADHFVLKGTRYHTINSIMQSIKRRVFLDCGIIEKGDIRLETLSLRVFKDAKPIMTLSPDRFNLLSLLVEKSPSFVSEEDIVKRLYDAELTPEKSAYVKILLHRLRGDLAPHLADRIQNQRGSGWAYIQPCTKE